MITLFLLVYYLICSIMFFKLVNDETEENDLTITKTIMILIITYIPVLNSVLFIDLCKSLLKIMNGEIKYKNNCL